MPDVRIEPIRAGKGPLIYVIGDAEAAHAAALCMKTAASVAAVIPPDWNGSLSPWKAPACFKGSDDFSGGADGFLAEAQKAISAFEEKCAARPCERFVCGYSLAGLCALYAVYRTDIFAGAASVSGSMWFDGWTEFMEDDARSMRGAKVYFSLGDREKKTRNPRLSKVEECTLRAMEILRSRGADTVFELNPGNHFAQPEVRLARAMDWLAGKRDR